jgi:hypothetical protein
MGYSTVVILTVTNNGKDIPYEEWTKNVDNINDPQIDKYILHGIFDDDGIDISYRWLVNYKDSFMHKVSIYFPNYIFKLAGDGEIHEDNWTETWKNGERTEYSNKLSMSY